MLEDKFFNQHMWFQDRMWGKCWKISIFWSKKTENITLWCLWTKKFWLKKSYSWIEGLRVKTLDLKKVSGQIHSTQTKKDFFRSFSDKFSSANSPWVTSNIYMHFLGCWLYSAGYAVQKYNERVKDEGWVLTLCGCAQADVTHSHVTHMAVKHQNVTITKVLHPDFVQSFGKVSLCTKSQHRYFPWFPVKARDFCLTH